MKKLFTLFFVFNFIISFGQSFLNGDFEINDADTLVGDYINTPATLFNSLMFDCNSYGTIPNIDILSTDTYGVPQNGTWFIAITGGQTDIINVKLSEPLIVGNSYTISFYDYKSSEFIPNKITIGLSSTNNEIGEIIYSTEELAQNEWTERSFTFVAAFAGQFISVYSLEGNSSTWTLLDNFSITNLTNTTTIVEEKNIRLVQNPVNNSLRLKADKPVSTGVISIISSTGKLIHKEKFDTIETLELDVSKLSSGFYFLKISTKDSREGSLKFIKT